MLGWIPDISILPLKYRAMLTSRSAATLACESMFRPDCIRLIDTLMATWEGGSTSSVTFLHCRGGRLGLALSRSATRTQP